MMSRSSVLWRLGVSTLAGVLLFACAASSEPVEMSPDDAGATLLELASTCSRPQDCASGVCVETSKRLLCSTRCSAPTDCIGGWTCAPRTDERAEGSSVCTCEPTAPEDSCDGLDNDCDGAVDNPASADASCAASVGPMFVCRNANCVCALECDGRCVDAKTDILNCGACGRSCGGGAQCVDGDCACSGNATKCGNACFDLNASADNCGACGKACPAGATCTAGECGCGLGQTSCGAACADLETDPNNCGACGTVCTAAAGQTATCVNRRCGTTTLLAASGMVTVPNGVEVYDRATDIVADEGSVYWRLNHRVPPFTGPMKFTALLRKIPAGGGASETIGEVEAEFDETPRLAASATELFTFALGKVFAVPKAGGPSRVVVEVAGARFKEIAVDGGDIFLAPSLWRVAVAGGPVQKLLPFQSAARFAFSSTKVHWVSNGELGSVPRSGGPVETAFLPSLPFLPDDAVLPLLSGSDSVYWPAAGGGRIDLSTAPPTPKPFANAVKTGARATQDDANIYAVAEGAQVDIVRIAKSSGVATTIATFPAGTLVDALAVNESAVFVALRRPHAGVLTLPRPSYLYRIEPK